VTSLMDAVYNNSTSVSVILDNRITGMTGHQENPGTGFTLMGEAAPRVNIPMLCKSLGMKEENIYEVNPLILDDMDRVLDEALAKDEPTVIIAKWPCILKKFSDTDKEEFDLDPKKCVVIDDKCKNCKMCVKTGCPAIYSGQDTVEINRSSCTGCKVCMQACPFDAIEMEA